MPGALAVCLSEHLARLLRASFWAFVFSRGPPRTSSVEHLAIRSVPYAYMLFLPGHRRQTVRLRKALAEHGVFTAAALQQPAKPLI